MTVYSPGKDSFLLASHLETLELEDVNFLDMGTGSGILAFTAAEKGAKVTAVDINPEAAKAVEKKTVEKDANIEVFQSDLFENVSGTFDVIVFNPPYLPGEDGIGDEEIWRGGEKGIEVTRDFLETVPDYLSSDGEALLVLSSRAESEQLVGEFDLEVVDSEKLWFEELFIARFE